MVVDPLREAVPDQWDGFVAEQGLVSLWRASLLERAAWSSQAPTVMAVVVDRADRPVALFHGRFLGVPARIGRYVAPGSSPAIGGVECRLHPIGAFAGHAFADGLDGADRAAAVRVFELGVGERWGARCPAVAYRQVEHQDLAALAGPGRVAVGVEPDLVLHNRWADLDGWFRSLPPKWRSQLRRIVASVDADPTVTVAVERSVPPLEAARLVHTVRTRYQRPLWVRPPVPVWYFEDLNRAPGTRYVTYRNRDGRLLAFSTAHDGATDIVLSYWGRREPADGGRANLYFHQYVRLVGLMVDEGRRAVRLGKGAAAVKARYGATPTPRWAVAGRR